MLGARAPGKSDDAKGGTDHRKSVGHGRLFGMVIYHTGSASATWSRNVSLEDRREMTTTDVIPCPLVAVCSHVAHSPGV